MRKGARLHSAEGKGRRAQLAGLQVYLSAPAGRREAHKARDLLRARAPGQRRETQRQRCARSGGARRKREGRPEMKAKFDPFKAEDLATLMPALRLMVRFPTKTTKVISFESGIELEHLQLF